MSTFYIATAIDYINGQPHLGHAYEKIGADVLSRYKKLTGTDTFFLVGTDEHSLNVVKSASAAGLSPKEYCDRMVLHFQKLYRVLHIDYDRFIRTTDADHQAVVQKVVEHLWDRGCIRKGSYAGLYCESCEAFLQQDQLASGRCPTHPAQEVARVEEENYFFTLSRFQEPLEKHLEEHPEFIEPGFRRSEIINRIKQGLQDISITRSGTRWGIPFPPDPRHNVYVWFDALLNYLTGAGYLLNERAYRENWPVDVHIVGKDITWFHCVVWPCLLLALEVPLPRKVFAHGHIHLNGQRLSKSAGIVVDPFELAEQFGPDVVRYYLMKAVPWGQDGNFSLAGLVDTYNSDLANDFGNLLSRTTAMINKYFGGYIPEPANQTPDDEIFPAAVDAVRQYHLFMESTRYGEALSAVFGLVGRANRYIDAKAPWKLSTDTAQQSCLATVLYSVVEVLRVSAWMLQPFMPSLWDRVLDQLGLTGQGAREAFNCTWGYAYNQVKVNRGAPLFPRLAKT